MKKNKRYSNAMTVAFLTKANFLARNVEIFTPSRPDPKNPLRRMKHPTYEDFLGMYDVIGLRPDHKTILIQCTTKKNLAKKCHELPKKPDFLFSLKSARVQVWSWRKVKGLPNGQEWAPLVKEAFLLEDETVIFKEVPPPSLDLFTGYENALPSSLSYDASGCLIKEVVVDLF